MLVSRLPQTPTLIRISIFGLIAVLTSCATIPQIDSLRVNPLTSAETQQVDALLDRLYRSFAYGADKEPDWDLMRSAFVENAQFVTEPAEGKAPDSQLLEAFITSWQETIRGSSAPRPSHDEWITGTTATKLGELIRVDVAFQAKKGNDTTPRKPGLDSLVLVKVDGQWKVLSFIVHYESKL